LPKMSAIENTTPNTILVSTVFIGKAPRYVRHISLGRACQKCAVGAGHRSQGRFAARIRTAHCSMRKLKLLVVVYRARPGGKRRAVTVAHRPVWPEPADTALSHKNRTHNNRQVLALGEHRILCSHRKSGRRSTASVQSPRVRSAGR
jgi:hypothetical protein